MQRNVDAGILGISLHSTVRLLLGLRDTIKKSSIVDEGDRESIIYKFVLWRLHSSFVVPRSSFRVPSFSTQSLCLAFPVVLLSNNFLFVASLTSIHGQGTLDSLSTGRRFFNTQLPSQIERKFLKSTWLDSRDSWRDKHLTFESLALGG